MKKVITILLVMFSSNIFCQSLSRSNDEEVQITEISNLDYSKGYRHIDGDWLSFDHKVNESYEEDLRFNAIPTAYFFYDNGKYSDYSLSRSLNFGKMRLIEARYKGEVFLLIHFDQVSGKYEYPSIREDWYTFTEDNFFIVSEEDIRDFQSQFSQKINEAFRVELKSELNDSFRADLDDDSIDKKIRKVLNKKPSTYMTEYLFFEVFPVDFEGSKLVRFNFKKESSFSDELKEFDPLVFDQYYFESDYDDFHNFIMSF